MRFERLRIQGLRCLADALVDLFQGIHLFAGANGAGKTSVLEAAYLLSHGHSFRSGAREALLQRGSPSMTVFAELSGSGDSHRRLGMGREGSRWEARLDGMEVPLGQLVQACAVVCFEPGSHALIAGPAEERRRFLDWGVFHVEHRFLVTWRRYQRALKQRNALLRSGVPGSNEMYEPWEREMSDTAVAIDSWRRSYLESLRQILTDSAGLLLPELGTVSLRYRRGWPDTGSLADVLSEQRYKDLARGHTTTGPHRADWAVAFEQAPLREHLSRGQEKLTALSCLLAQAQFHATSTGQWPVICLDDLASELDLAHQDALIQRLAGVGAQVLVTGTECPSPLRSHPHHMFHVERGEIRPLL